MPLAFSNGEYARFRLPMRARADGMSATVIHVIVAKRAVATRAAFFALDTA